MIWVVVRGWVLFVVVASVVLVVGGGSGGVRGDDGGGFVGAGCYVVLRGGVVVGVNRFLRRIQLPIGRRKEGETARQTAYRETLEETGIKVRVGELLVSLRSGEVHLFACTPIVDLHGDYAALKPLDRTEVSEVLVMDPHTMINHDGRIIDTPWRFPAMRWMVLMLYALQAPDDNKVL